MKSKQRNSAKSILSDRIADALTVRARADIEDDQVFGTKPHTVSRADLGSSDSEDETAISDFRKRNVNLLSEISKKYEGQVVSRKDLAFSDDDTSDNDASTDGLKISNVDAKSENSNVLGSDSEDFASDAESVSKLQKKSVGKYPYSEDDESVKDDEESGDDEDNDDDDDDDEEDQGDEDEGEDDTGYDISQMDVPVKENFEHVKKQNISEEAKKGICVRNQLLVWEGLLEMRIHLQRCLTTANQMPMSETYQRLSGDDSFAEESNATKVNVATVLDKLLSLQSILFKNFPETKTLSSNKSNKEVTKQDQKPDSDEEIPSDTDNEEIPSDTDAEEEPTKEDLSKLSKKETTIVTKKRKLEDYENQISTSHKAFKSFRDKSIQKWNDKTRFASATNIKNAPTNTILQQISYILSDRDKLVRRTQLKRSEYDIIGYKKETNNEDGRDQNGTELNPVQRDRKDDDEYISEIFDDSDFYHQLLRELIECKSADVSDPVQLSRQWIALQQMRSKMKRRVDTKATKGRKIKYVVHNKLVNFMASEKCAKWTDESKNELYSSLFGQMFEYNNLGLNVNL